MRKSVKYTIALTFVMVALIFSFLWFFVLPFVKEFSSLESNLIPNIEETKGKLTEILPFLVGEINQKPPTQKSPEHFKERKEENQPDQINNFRSQQAPLSKEQEQKQQEIENKYRPLFYALQIEYERRLNGLVNAAWSDYLSVREGRSKKSLPELAQHYSKSGRALEGECDTRFYNLVARMEGELKAASLPMDLADKAKERYIKAKSAYRQQIIKAALKKL